MSVEKMTMVTLSGPKDMIDKAIGSFVLNREFHPENTVLALSGFKRLKNFEGTNPYTAELNKAINLAAQLDVKPEFADFKGKDFTLESVQQYLQHVTSLINDFKQNQSSLSENIKKNTAIMEQLLHFKGLDEQLNDLLAMKYLKVRLGRAKKKDFTDIFYLADERDDVFLIDTGTENDWVYCVYFVLPKMEDQIDSVFATRGFERIRISADAGFEGDAQETASKLNELIKADTQELQNIEEKLSGIKTAEAGELLARYSYLRFMSDVFDFRSTAGYIADRFYIIGWIPSAYAEDFVKECESVESFSCIRTNQKDVKHSKPPVKLKSNFLTRIFSPFIDMYGLPNNDEIDPSLFFAMSYTLIFGIMFGDVGQGAVLSLFGLLLWKKRQMWLGRILSIVGISSVVFGFVYGNLFGYEHILPGFKVLENGNTMTMLYISVAIGVVMLLACMCMNIINGIRQRDVKKIFFSPNGLAGFIMYLSIAVAAVSLAMFGTNLFTMPYILGLIVLPLLLMMSAEPLTKLVTGQKDWMPKSISSFFVEGFFELFETVLSFVSNTVSFLRIGAFVISHAGMMMVVFLLSANANGGNSIFGVIIGNLLVMGIEATLVCIQVMRLEFYEMFGRFYTSGGRPFSPKTVSYEPIEN